MKFENKFDEGVSPVVGVILMVAITVILSAIIATFVLDLGGTVSQNPQAGVTFDQTPDGQVDTNGDGAVDTQAYDVDVQAVSMENADSLKVSDDGSYSTITTQFSSPTNVGDIATVSDLVENDKVTVTATLEGKTAVIQTYTVDA